MAARRTLTREEDVQQAVDTLLASFGVPGDTAIEPEESTAFEQAPRPSLKTGEQVRQAPSAEVDALWGTKAKTPR